MSANGDSPQPLGVWQALALVTVAAGWLAGLQIVLATTKNQSLPFGRLALCAAIALGAIAASRMSASARLLVAAWAAITWSLASAVGYLSKTDMMFGHHQGPFAQTQAATFAAWIALACIAAWIVTRFGFDQRRRNWKTWGLGLIPLAFSATLLLPLAGDVGSWDKRREREELSDPHSPRSEVRHVDGMREYIQFKAKTDPDQPYAIYVKTIRQRLITPAGHARLNAWEDELRQQGLLQP